jgi:hypothetical protein
MPSQPHYQHGWRLRHLAHQNAECPQRTFQQQVPELALQCARRTEPRRAGVARPGSAGGSGAAWRGTTSAKAEATARITRCPLYPSRVALDADRAARCRAPTADSASRGPPRLRQPHPWRHYATWRSACTASPAPPTSPKPCAITTATRCDHSNYSRSSDFADALTDPHPRTPRSSSTYSSHPIGVLSTRRSWPRQPDHRRSAGHLSSSHRPRRHYSRNRV